MVLSQCISNVGVWNIHYLTTEENQSFGLEIVLKEGDKVVANKKAFPLSKDAKEIEKLANLLCENEVFPISMDGILEDLGYFQ